MSDEASVTAPKVRDLIERGVVFPCPASVEVGSTVDPNRIAPGVVIHVGCRLHGEATSMGPGCVIGAEGPVAIDNCQLGRGVALKGGCFTESVFLDGASMGLGAHVRAGTLLEEEANGAHTVGLKQTVLLSYVTAGSLINLCDCLMAGGTSRKDHSEIGSSYVHFNFTPHGDKATPSLIGDVPRGVMLDRPPIFLGGQGGLVGPARLEYGCVIPAGVVYRGDALEPERLLLPAPGAAPESRVFRQGVYRQVSRIVANNLIYIGNILALRAWYLHARRLTMAGDAWAEACHEGALRAIDAIFEERIKRLGDLAGKMKRSLEVLARQPSTGRIAVAVAQQQAFRDAWPRMEEALRASLGSDGPGESRDGFLSQWEAVAPGRAHTQAVARLGPAARALGTAWLQDIVDAAAGLWRH